MYLVSVSYDGKWIQSVIGDDRKRLGMKETDDILISCRHISARKIKCIGVGKTTLPFSNEFVVNGKSLTTERKSANDVSNQIKGMYTKEETIRWKNGIHVGGQWHNWGINWRRPGMQ